MQLLTRPREIDAPALPPTAAPTRPLRATAVYWLAVVALVAVYLALWLHDFQYVYGWLQDDIYVFDKALDTIHDWRAAFTTGYDAHQPYFYLISYLPLILGLTLPSYPVPPLEGFISQFRFLLLWALLFHAVLLLVWAWFATRLVRSRLVAWLSLLLLATSPTYTLWSPQPESRLVGMPFLLPGLWLLLRSDGLRGSTRAIVGWPLLAGSLFGLAQSLHYTSLYLIAPVSVAIWGVRLVRGWRQGAYWLGLAAFVLGCVWQQALVEFVGDVVIGVPWQHGPTLSLFELRDVTHASPWSTTDNVQLWQDWFLSQMGLPLLIAVAVGWGIYVWRRPSRWVGNRLAHVELGLGLVLALVYLGVSGSMPFFRQTSVLQPFFFLFAGLALVEVGRWLSRRRLAGQVAISGALLLGAGVIPWQQAYAVFEGHRALGRALVWANTYKGDRPLVMYVNDASNVTDSSLGLSDFAAQNSVVLTYFPWRLLSEYPLWLAYGTDAQPLVSWPTLYATDTLYAEQRSFGHIDYRAEPMIADVRVFDAQTLAAPLAAPPLAIESVTADSTQSQLDDPANVLNRTLGSDPSASGTKLGWASADAPGPHALEFTFATAVPLSRLQIVQTPEPNVTQPTLKIARIDRVHIDVADDSGAYTTVWSGADLTHQTLLSAAWAPRPTRQLRIVVDGAVLPAERTNVVTIERVVFPGFAVIPPPRQALPPPQIATIEPSTTPAGPRDQDLTVTIHGVAAVPGTVATLDTTPLQTTWGNDQLLTAFVPRTLLAEAGRHTITLRNEAGESNAVDFTVGDPAPDPTSAAASAAASADPLVLLQVSPSDVHVGNQVGVQPNGQAAISISAQNAGTGTVVILDGQPLPTVVGDASWVTATLPGDIYQHAGSHQVYLRDGARRSNPFAFTVQP